MMAFLDSIVNQSLILWILGKRLYVWNLGLTIYMLSHKNSHLGKTSKKKTADLVKMSLLGGRGSEKLLKFHHLQMMKNMEGWGSQSNISLLHRTVL